MKIELALIKQIIRSAKEQDINVPAKTRLIKLLYLIEVEYFKHFQKRLTNLPWQFYHYGPYSVEIESILGSPDIEEMQFISCNGRAGSQFDLAGDEIKKDDVHSDIKRFIDSIVKEWGDVDLNKLLDYVYFETEPMIGAKRGDILDFTKIKTWSPPEKLKTVHIDPKKFSALKDKYLSHIQMVSKTKLQFSLTDKTYIDCIKAWDEDILPTQLNGKVIVKLGDRREE